MSRPEDISADAWGTAYSIAMEAFETDGVFHANTQIRIARAIMAERERCALITFAAYERKTEVCSRIIRRIRSGEGLVR